MTKFTLNILLLLAASLSFLISNSVYAGEKMPSWLKKKLKSAQPPIEIERYLYKDKTAYLLAFVCCDHGTRELYDAKGKLLCKLPESFAGLDDAECPGFNKEAKHVGSVLKKQ